jgi:hypothetical protein
MSAPSRPVVKWLLVGLAPLLLLGSAFYAVRQRLFQAGPPSPARDHPPGFRAVTGDAGITFRMNFLPGEQGQNFKINLYDHGCGVAVGDYDGDGRDDIYFCNQLGANALYHNNGDGTFTDVTAKAGVGLGDRVCVAATFADTLNSGRQDLYVTSTRGGNVLFRNQGDDTFKDVTKEAGLVHVGHSQTAAFFDYDNDGFLDLLVTNTAQWTEEMPDASQRYYPGASDLYSLAKSPKEYNVLYHNNGDGTFTDVTEKSGLKGRGWGGDVAVFDYDEDGRPDVLITNMFGASQLYHNNGDGTFTDVTGQALGRTSWGAIGSKAFDFDNDGRLDLLIVDMHSDMWVPFDTNADFERMVKRTAGRKFATVTGPLYDLDPGRKAQVEQQFVDMFHILPEDVVFGNTLFKNLGNGKFEECSDRTGLETFWPWGIVTGDFDNDGHEDVFLPSGMGFPWFYWPSALMMNNGNATFGDRAEAEGIEPPPGGHYLPDRISGQPAARSSRCAATADFTGDGRLDIITSNFNDAPYLFKNQFPRRHHVEFRLRGTRSNRDAVGAVVKLYIGKEVQVRQVQAAGGYLSQSSKTLHFGLGERAGIDRAEIRWPSGTQQTIEHPTVDQLHDLVEPPG